MTGEIYFQWQNEYLLRTIYPLREMKLRDFLTAYFEIDIWKQYKDKHLQDIQEDLKYCQSEEIRSLNDAIANYARLLQYMLDDDVTDTYQAQFPGLDVDVMTKINLLHKAFRTYFPNYNNPIKEKYFISARICEFENLRKNVTAQIAGKQRILRAMGSAWPSKTSYEQAVQKLTEVSLKMVNQELALLYDFLNAYGCLFSYKQQLLKIRAQKEKERADASTKLAALKSSESALNSSLDAVTRLLARLQKAPDKDSLKNYFLDDDVADIYHSQIPDADMEVMLAINNLHKTVKSLLPTYKNPAVERYFIGQRVKEVEDLRARKQRELSDKQRASQYMPANWPNRAENDQAIQRLANISLKMIDTELNKLYDFLWAYDVSGKQPPEINALIAQKQQEQAVLQNQLQANRGEQAAQAAIIQAAAALLDMPENDQLIGRVTTRQVTVADIVRMKTDAYQAQLMQKNKDELLEEIVARFTQEPERYPLWLQYMVVHFSGMRYQTAHGSWADPKDLLLSFKTRLVGDEIKRANEDAIEALCEQKYYLYKSIQAPEDAESIHDEGDAALPLLATATEAEWRARIDHHLGRIHPESKAYKRRALLDFRVDEESYEVEKMTDQQVLDELEELKNQLPDWMWKEIVQVTQLKLKEVTDANWENLSQADLDARWTRQMASYRQMMNDWKARYLTGWRQEHELTSDLVVTRAVCNEVAEHINHVRGNNPGAGLSARPEWYRNQERNPALAGAAERPYLLKVKAAEDMRAGASLLYLRWVNKVPPVWNIARPLVLKNGEDIMPQGQDAKSRVTSDGAMYTRATSVDVFDDKGKKVDTRTETQWLRWMHEATVVEVCETADGPTVYTFETALPFDDKRQATIGIFKHSVSELRYQVSPSVVLGTFCGFSPEGKVPYDRLQIMLNWNRILLRDAFTNEQMANLWNSAAPQAAFAAVTAPFALISAELVSMEVVPPLRRRAHTDWIECMQWDMLQEKIIEYSPEVQLQRGMRLGIDRSMAIQSGKITYYPVTECRLEPRAEGLYVRSDYVIEAPEASGSIPVRLKRDVHLRGVLRGSRDGTAILESGDVFLPGGTRFRVSTVHRAGAKDVGDGLIIASDGEPYYLIVDCPRRISAQGLFVPMNEVRAIPEKQYTKKAMLL